MHYDYKTENTCSQIISLDIEGDVIGNVRFTGGCNGNLKAIPILVTCGRRPTSCSDQLARAVRAAYEAQKEVETAQ